MNQYRACSVGQQVGWIESARALVQAFFNRSATPNGGSIFNCVHDFSAQITRMERESVVPHELIILTHFTVDTLGHLMWKEKFWMSNPTVVLDIARSSIFEIVLNVRPDNWQYATKEKHFEQGFYSFLNYLFDRWFQASANNKGVLDQLDHSTSHPLEQPSKQEFARKVFIDYSIRHTEAYKEVKSSYGITGHPQAPNPAFDYVLRFGIDYHETRWDTSILDQKKK